MWICGIPMINELDQFSRRFWKLLTSGTLDRPSNAFKSSRIGRNDGRGSNWSRKLWPVAWPQYLHTGVTRAIRPCSSHAWRNLQRISMTHIPPGSVEIFRLSGTGPKGSFGSHVSVNAKNHLREPSILFGSSGQFHSVSFTFFLDCARVFVLWIPVLVEGKVWYPLDLFFEKDHIFNPSFFFSD